MAWVTTIEAQLSGGYYGYASGLSGLLGYWRLGEASGVTAIDDAGNHLDGTLAGGYSLGVTGAVADGNKAVQFNGTTGYISRANTGLTPTTGVTLACFMKFTNIPGLGVPQAIGGAGTVVNGIGVPSGYTLTVQGAGFGNALLTFAIARAIGGPLLISASWTPNVNAFNHLCGTYDGTTLQLYIDGVSVASASRLPDAISYGTTTTFRLGQDDNLYGYLDGTVDEATVYNRALTQAEVTGLYGSRLLGGWTDITADVMYDPVVIDYGIRSYSPDVRIAETGTLSFTLNNLSNSGGVKGYYSPMNASKRTGWDYGIPVRAKQVSGGVTRYFRGVLDQIVVTPGKYVGVAVHCVAVDWMDQAAREIVMASLQVNQRSDQIWTAILGKMSRRPLLTSTQTGSDTYSYALDNVPVDAKVLTAGADLARSELGYIYNKRDATEGETVCFEGRTTRAAVATVLVTLDNTMSDLQLPGSRSDILNRVRTIAYPRVVVASITVAQFDAGTGTVVQPGETKVFWLSYTDPTQRNTVIGATNCIAPVATTDYTMNTAADGSSTDLTSSFTVTATFFASSVKLVVINAGVTGGYITAMKVRGDGLKALNPVTSETTIVGSAALYGDNPVTLDMIYQSDPNVAQLASQYIAYLFQSPLSNVRQVSFWADKNATLLAAAMSGDISSRIAIAETVSGITAVTNYYINAVKLETQGKQVRCTWGLTPADSASYWLLGTAGASELGGSLSTDGTTVLGYA